MVRLFRLVRLWFGAFGEDEVDFGARAHSVNFRNFFRFLTGQLGLSSAPSR